MDKPLSIYKLNLTGAIVLVFSFTIGFSFVIIPLVLRLGLSDLIRNMHIAFDTITAKKERERYHSSLAIISIFQMKAIFTPKNFL